MCQSAKFFGQTKFVCHKANLTQPVKLNSNKSHSTDLLTNITIVVMTAARNTNPPKAPKATIAPRFNFAP